MPALITDEMLNEFCAAASPGKLGPALQERYDGLADRLGLYNPFVPGERDEFWRELTSVFSRRA
jgi:hypothetical protein